MEDYQSWLITGKNRKREHLPPLSHSLPVFIFIITQQYNHLIRESVVTRSLASIYSIETTDIRAFELENEPPHPAL